MGSGVQLQALQTLVVLSVLQWATLRIERGAKEKNHPLYKPYVNGEILPCMDTWGSEFFWGGGVKMWCL